MISGRDPDEVSFSLGFNLVTTLPKAADEISSLKIAIRSRLLRVVERFALENICPLKQAVFVFSVKPLRRLKRRKPRKTGFVINLNVEYGVFSVVSYWNFSATFSPVKSRGERLE